MQLYNLVMQLSDYPLRSTADSEVVYKLDKGSVYIQLNPANREGYVHVIATGDAIKLCQQWLGRQSTRDTKGRMMWEIRIS